MERSFNDWLQSRGFQNNKNGFLEQVHFTYEYDGKTKNGWMAFLFPTLKLIIELDGNHHLKRQHLDQIRDDHLRSRGYSIVRITHKEYVNKTRIDEVIDLLEELASPV